MVNIVIVLGIMVVLGFFIWRRLVRSNLDPITIENAEKRLGSREALQFALDHGLPLRTRDGETDGFNVWNARNVSGLRVPGDLSGRN